MLEGILSLRIWPDKWSLEWAFWTIITNILCIVECKSFPLLWLTSHFSGIFFTSIQLFWSDLFQLRVVSPLLFFLVFLNIFNFYRLRQYSWPLNMLCNFCVEYEWVQIFTLASYIILGAPFLNTQEYVNSVVYLLWNTIFKQVFLQFLARILLVAKQGIRVFTQVAHIEVVFRRQKGSKGVCLFVQLLPKGEV